MVERESSDLDRIFGALADPTRRGMLESLALGEAPIGELARPYEMSFAAASKHVRVLEIAGLVRREVRGRQHYCRVDAAQLARASNWLAAYAAFWHERMDALERLLDGTSLA